MKITDFGPLGTRYFRWDDESSPLPYHAVSIDIDSRVIIVESLFSGNVFSFDPDLWWRLRRDPGSRAPFFGRFGFRFEDVDRIVRLR